MAIAVFVAVAVAVLVAVSVAVLVDVAVAVLVEVGVGVAPPKTYETAAPAFTIPLPQIPVLQVLPPGKLVTVFCRICNTWAGVRSGSSE